MKALLNAQNFAILMMAALLVYFAGNAAGRMTERIITTIGSVVVFYIAALCIAAFLHTVWAWCSKRKPWSLLCLLNITAVVLITALCGISAYHATGM